MNNPYLISCEHEVYCQGYEYVHDTFLVYAASFAEAYDKLKDRLKNVRYIENKTIE